MPSSSRPVFRLLADELAAHIIEEAHRILETAGILMEHVGARHLLLDHGARADAHTGRVYFPRSVIERALATCPDSFDLFDLEGNRTFVIGGDTVHFDPGSAALRIHDPVLNIERDAATAECVKFHRLVEGLDSFHLQSTGLVSSDVPPEIQDSYRLFIALQFCRKPIVTGIFREDGFTVMRDLLATVRGSEADLARKPLAIFDACPSAPLRWSALTSHSVIECARAGIPSEFIAVPLAGATGPVTLADALAQHAAENLAGIVLAQVASPGCPVVFGGSPAIFDMRTGNTPLGAIESMMLNVGHVEIGKRLGLPTHAYLGLSDAKSPDAQAGLESGIGTTLAALAGVNVISGGGMLDFESCQSLEKLVIDNDACGMAYRLIEGIRRRGDGTALDIIVEAGQAGDFLSLQHTRDWYRKEQHVPRLLNRDEYPRWTAAGKPTLLQRAEEKVKELLTGEPELVCPAEMARELRAILERHAARLGLGVLPPVSTNRM